MGKYRNYTFDHNIYINPFVSIVYQLTGRYPIVKYFKTEKLFFVRYKEDAEGEYFTHREFIKSLDQLYSSMKNHKPSSYSTARGPVDRNFSRSLFKDYDHGKTKH